MRHGGILGETHERVAEPFAQLPFVQLSAKSRDIQVSNGLVVGKELFQGRQRVLAAHPGALQYRGGADQVQEREVLRSGQSTDELGVTPLALEFDHFHTQSGRALAVPNRLGQVFESLIEGVPVQEQVDAMIDTDGPKQPRGLCSGNAAVVQQQAAEVGSLSPVQAQAPVEEELFEIQERFLVQLHVRPSEPASTHGG